MTKPNPQFQRTPAGDADPACSAIERMNQIFSFLSIFLATTSVSFAADPNVGYLKAGEPRIDGSACEFSDRAGVILRSDWVDRYWLRIDGALTELRSTKSEKARDIDAEQSRISEVLTKGGAIVSVELKLTARGEDSATYTGRLTLTKDKIKKEYRITGGCGA